MVDLGAYNDQALEDFRQAARAWSVETFDEGDGVLIIELDVNPTIVASSDDNTSMAPTKSEALPHLKSRHLKRS